MGERFVWYGPVRHLGGYGEVARNYVRGLAALGADLAVLDCSASHAHIGDGPAREVEALLTRPADPAGATVVYHMAPPELPVGLSRYPAPGAARRVACTITECDRLPGDWVAALAPFDEVWVPGTFHVESFVASGVPREKMRLVPYGIDTEVFRPGPAAPTSGRFRFLYTFVFDWRKGFDLLLEAYLREFRRDDPTELVIKVVDHRPDRSPRVEFARAVCERVDLFDPGLPRVTVIDESLYRDEMIRLYRSADLYISTDRANGWGMPCHEAMACGRPAAAIDWSGSTEFMHAANALPIPAGGLIAVDPRLSGERPEYAGLRWPEVGVDDVRRVLRTAVDEPARLRELAEAGRREIHERFDMVSAARAILTRDSAPYRSREGLAETVRAGLDLDDEPEGGRRTVGWIGPVHGRSGYAAAGRGIVSATRAEGHVVRAVALDQPDGTADPIDLGPQGAAPHLWVLHCLPVNPDGTPAWETLAASVDGPIVGATCFETAGMPAEWVEACEVVREVWVPSPFNLGTFVGAGLDPDRVHVVPYPVDCERFAPGPPRERGDAPFTFLSVFEWTWRKGWDALLRAWVEEFGRDEDVRLRILTSRGAGARGEGHPVEQAMRLIADLGHDPSAIPDVDLLLDGVGPDGLIDLYRSADCFVLPSRGEGMGMPVLEAMACGLPVIATDFGGYQHLMSEETALPVEVEAMVPAHRLLLADNPLYRGQELAEPSVASLRRRMREAVEDPGGLRRRADGARIEVARLHGPQAAAAAVSRRLRALVGVGPVAPPASR